ncbi:MAG: fibronectin type III domain-containing protein [Cryobacterium sp.]|nr:fibronectin type III domain-containing protein [Cryobacterium sp.]
MAALTAVVGVSVAVLDAISSPSEASAIGGFNPANIIGDAQFFDGNAMSQQQIQAFLDEKIGGCLNSNCLNVKRVDSTARPADPMCGAFDAATAELTSTLIYRVQQACGISAKVLLVTLQKEQSLATHRSPSDSRLDRAMGYACPDNPAQPGWCDPAYGGLSNQIYRAAWQLKRYGNPPGTSNYFTWFPVGAPSAVRYHPDPACGSSVLVIQNRATAALYYYTPYQPNAAALANPRGTGDACSTHGNRNFWVFYSDWFDLGSYVPPEGSPSAPTDLKVSVNSGAELTLTWSPPTSPGTTPITDYVISYTSMYHPNPVVVNDGVSTATTFTANNPTPGLAFTFWVQAKNATGLGPAATITATPPR